MQFMEIIIPTDENSPGAKQARTAAFATSCCLSARKTCNKWREGLELFRLEAARSSLESAVAKAAKEEQSAV